VAVSGDYVYVGSFGQGRVSIIDANTDAVVTNVEPERTDFQPTSPAVNPLTGWVHFPDYQGGRVVIINGTDLEAEPVIANQFGFSPFELVVAKSLEGYNFVTMRDAITENPDDPTPFKIRGLNSVAPFDFDELALILPSGPAPRSSGSPHAIGCGRKRARVNRASL
jgi:YVTN family beta-propeller protein